MASIQISELHPAGSELLHDSESFLNELNDEQDVLGGTYYYKYFNTNKTIVSAVSVVGNTANANTYGNNNTVGKAGA